MLDLYRNRAQGFYRDQQFSSQGVANGHIATTDPQHQCSRCGQFFTSLDLVTAHEDEEHDQTKPDPSNESWRSSLFLFDALTLTWNCLNCEKTFQLKWQLEEHAQSHNLQAPLQMTPNTADISTVYQERYQNNSTKNWVSDDNNDNTSGDSVDDQGLGRSSQEKNLPFPQTGTQQQVERCWNVVNSVLTSAQEEPSSEVQQMNNTDDLHCQIYPLQLANDDDSLSPIGQPDSQHCLLDENYNFCHVCQIRFTRQCLFDDHLKRKHTTSTNPNDNMTASDNQPSIPSANQMEIIKNTKVKELEGDQYNRNSRNEGNNITIKTEVVEASTTTTLGFYLSSQMHESLHGFGVIENIDVAPVQIPLDEENAEDEAEESFECRYCSREFVTLKEKIIHERMIHGELLNRNLKVRSTKRSRNTSNRTKSNSQSGGKNKKKQGRGHPTRSSLTQHQRSQTLIMEDLSNKLGRTEKLLRKTLKYCRKQSKAKKLDRISQDDDNEQQSGWSCNITQNGIKITSNGGKEKGQSNVEKGCINEIPPVHECNTKEKTLSSGLECEKQDKVQCQICWELVDGSSNLIRHLYAAHSEDESDEDFGAELGQKESSLGKCQDSADISVMGVESKEEMNTSISLINPNSTQMAVGSSKCKDQVDHAILTNLTSTNYVDNLMLKPQPKKNVETVNGPELNVEGGLTETPSVIQRHHDQPRFGPVVDILTRSKSSTDNATCVLAHIPEQLQEWQINSRKLQGRMNINKETETPVHLNQSSLKKFRDAVVAIPVIDLENEEEEVETFISDMEPAVQVITEQFKLSRHDYDVDSPMEPQREEYVNIVQGDLLNEEGGATETVRTVRCMESENPPEMQTTIHHHHDQVGVRPVIDMDTPTQKKKSTETCIQARVQEPCHDQEHPHFSQGALRTNKKMESLVYHNHKQLVNPNNDDNSKLAQGKESKSLPPVVKLIKVSIVLDRLTLNRSQPHGTISLKRKLETQPSAGSKADLHITTQPLQHSNFIPEKRELRVVLKRVDDDDFDFNSLCFLTKMC